MSRFRPDTMPDLRAVRVPVGIIATALLLNLAAFLYVTRPEWNASAAVDGATAASAQAQASLEPQLERARQRYGGIVGAETALRDLRDLVGSQSGSVSDVVTTIRAAVDAAGLRADRIAYDSQPIPELGLTQMQIQLPVRGQYRDLRRLLDELLDGPMFVVLERVSASSPSQSDPTGDLSMSVAASVFLNTEADSPESSAEMESAPDLALPADPVAAAGALADQLRSLPPMPLEGGAFDLERSRLDEHAEDVPSSARNLFALVELRARPRPRADQPPVDDNFTPEPVLPYDLIGVNRTSEGLLATLTDGDLVLVVRQGQLLPDGYLVAEIAPMSVTLEAGDQTNKIPLRPNDDR